MPMKAKGHIQNDINERLQVIGHFCGFSWVLQRQSRYERPCALTTATKIEWLPQVKGQAIAITHRNTGLTRPSTQQIFLPLGHVPVIQEPERSVPRRSDVDHNITHANVTMQYLRFLPRLLMSYTGMNEL